MTHRAVFEVTHWMGLAPLAWLGVSRAKGRRDDVRWWLIASAFGVSWLADTAAHVVDPWIITSVYPVSQSALIASALLDVDDVLTLIVGLVAVAIGALIWRGPATAENPDALLHVVAFGVVVGIAARRPELALLRLSLLVGFGVGLAGYLAYVFWPSWPTWALYQGARGASIALFCAAATRPGPSLRVIGPTDRY